MKIRKGAVAGVALLASLAFAAGCQGTETPSGNGSGTTTTTAPSVKPADELADGVKKLTKTSYKFEMIAGPMEMKGAADPASKAMKMDMKVAAQGTNLAIDIIAVGSDYYLKIAGLPIPGIDPGKYMHLDATKVKSLKQFGMDSLDDPTNTAKLVEQFATVEKTGPGAFKGTMDLTKSASAAVNDQAIKALGDAAKSVPFQATLDGEGRLSSLTFIVPSTGTTPPVPVTMKYTDFGSAAGVTKPATSDTVEAPAAVYAMFG